MIINKSSNISKTLENNVKIVSNYQCLWEQQNEGTCGAFEPILSDFINKHPQNIDFLQVLHKCFLINSLYSTRISKSDLIDIANGIINTKDFDDLLENASDIKQAVKVIKSFTNRRNYAFATKYCALHFENRFPIYDSLSVSVLQYYQDKDKFYRQAGNYDVIKESVNYNEYVNIYNRFIDSYLQNTNVTYREVDKYLWTFGKRQNENMKNYILQKI